ncbi:unnamed protein product [Phytophthora lilii]|uniref:Alpha-1,3-glucosyltransferase n=1 Tax=Phytophthora lilii TaxID=2077276 RepID=A0A9W6TKC3_9STRA|nr:unnamed protein product [Phytophthora lilii]
MLKVSSVTHTIERFRLSQPRPSTVPLICQEELQVLASHLIVAGFSSLIASFKWPTDRLSSISTGNTLPACGVVACIGYSIYLIINEKGASFSLPSALTCLGLLRWHAKRTVEANSFAIEHLVVDDRVHQLRVFFRVAQTAWERNTLAKSLLHLLGKTRQQRRHEQTWKGNTSSNVSALNIMLHHSPRFNFLPGAMVFTRIPYDARSLASGSVIPTIAPLLAAYAACPICPSYAAMLAVLMMMPRSPPGPGLVFDMLHISYRESHVQQPKRVDLSHSPLRRETRDVEGADRVNIEGLLELEELVHALLAQRLDGQRDAGAVDDGVHRLAEGRLGQLPRHFHAVAGRQVAQDHARTVLHEARGGGASESGGGASHEGNTGSERHGGGGQFGSGDVSRRSGSRRLKLPDRRGPHYKDGDGRVITTNATMSADHEASMLQRGLQFLEQNDEKRAGAWLVWLLLVLVRWLVGLHSYSGEHTPPLFGDYEAQRHWMEITTSLRVSDWYFNTTSNDLLYWGLDYPPLTAYVSYLFGLAAEVAEPSMVELTSSRGYESATSKVFMRTSVLLYDVLLFIPAIYCVARAMYGSEHWTRRTAFLLLILLQPAVLLIDHGHFQVQLIYGAVH